MTMYRTLDLFDGYQWPENGAMRKDIEAWLRAVSGYTSNRVMQNIINQALEDGVIHKNLRTRKYHPGKDCSAA